MNPPPTEGLASRLFLGPALRAQPDRRLVTLVRDGYEAAFEEIVRRYGKALGRYAAAIVGGRSEEVTQDAFSKALLALRGLEGELDIELRPWLYRIVRNTALNDLRDRPPETAELGEALAGGRSAAEEFERREELSRLLERLRALPEPQRAAIVMRELEGLGHEEIADALGLSGGAARQAIFRARQALRDGVGAMIPLPLLRALIDHGVEAGGAAGAGGAVAAGTAMGGAGASLKVGAIAAAVLAGGVGAGLALKDHNHRPGPESAAAAVSREAGAGATSPSASPTPESAARATALGLGEGRSAGGGSNSGSSGSSGEGPRGDIGSGESHGGEGGGEPALGGEDGGRHGGQAGLAPNGGSGGRGFGGGGGGSGGGFSPAPGSGDGGGPGPGGGSGGDGLDGGQEAAQLPPPPTGSGDGTDGTTSGFDGSSSGLDGTGSSGSGSGTGGGPGPG